MGVSTDCPNLLGTPIISRTGKATDFKLGGYIYRANLNKSPEMEKMENFEKKGAWAYPETA